MSATNNSKKDYSSFDKLSTEELETILYKDSLSSENNDSDVEAILYITSLLVDREQKNPSGKFIDVDTAWKSFNENYRPYANGTSLYDFDDVDCETEISTFKPTNNSDVVNPKKRTKHWRGLLKMGIAVAAVIVIFLASSLIAYAHGYDIWEAFASWTRETFGFSSELNSDISTKSHTIPEQLKDMADAMSEYGISSDCLPSYLPENCAFIDFMINECQPRTTFVTLLSCDTGDEIQISYTFFNEIDEKSAIGACEYQKDDTEPQLYEINSISYYIMNNDGNYFCSWHMGKLEGYISGIRSEDELIKIISSIKEV